MPHVVVKKSRCNILWGLWCTNRCCCCCTDNHGRWIKRFKAYGPAWAAWARNSNWQRPHARSPGALHVTIAGGGNSSAAGAEALNLLPVPPGDFVGALKIAMGHAAHTATDKALAVAPQVGLSEDSCRLLR